MIALVLSFKQRQLVVRIVRILRRSARDFESFGRNRSHSSALEFVFSLDLGPLLEDLEASGRGELITFRKVLVELFLSLGVGIGGNQLYSCVGQVHVLFDFGIFKHLHVKRIDLGQVLVDFGENACN